MGLCVVRFLSLLLAAVALGAGLAHLLALPNKIHLSREDYLVVPQVYRGWALLGIVDIGALAATLVPAVWQELRRQWEYSHAVCAGLYLVAPISLIFSVLRKDAHEP